MDNMRLPNGSKVNNSSSSSVLIGMLLFMLGATSTFGEQMNDIIPLSSRLFVIIGSMLVLIYLLKIMVLMAQTGYVSRKEYIKTCASYWIFFVLITVLILSRQFMSSSSSISLFALLDLLKVPIFMLICFALASEFNSDKKLLEYFILGYLVGFLIAIFFSRPIEFETSVRYCGTYMNPNTYAHDCILAFYLSLYLFKNKKFFVFKFVMIILSLFCLLRSGSRGALVSLIVGLAMLLIITPNLKKKTGMLVLTGITSVIGIIFVSATANEIFERLFLDSYAGNVRLEIWQAYLSNIKEFMWFGMSREEMSFIHKFTPHNSLFGVWVRYGIFAFISYLTVNVWILVKCFKNNRRKSTYESRIILAMFVSYLWAGMTMESLTVRSSWIFMALALFNLNYYYYKRRGN